MENVKTRVYVFYFSIALLLIAVVYQGSYAYYTASLNITGNGTGNITTANLELQMITNQYINATPLVPLTSAEVPTYAPKTIFTITNNQYPTITIFLGLTEFDISNNLKASSDFKWQLLRNSTILATGDFTTATKTGSNYDDFIFKRNDSSIIKETIAYGATNTYELRIYINKTELNQNSLLEGTLTGKVKYVATSAD